jgi:hypothetical protein
MQKDENLVSQVAGDQHVRYIARQLQIHTAPTQARQPLELRLYKEFSRPVNTINTLKTKRICFI